MKNERPRLAGYILRIADFRNLICSLCMVLLVGCRSEHNAVQKSNALDNETTLYEVVDRRELIGERLYRTYCAGCHGETGEGDGLHSFTLNPPPANHADSTFMSKLSNDYLFKVISSGGASVEKSAEMPTWRDVLNKNEIENVIIYIRTLPRRQNYRAPTESTE
ncbi:MAG: cytochrome c [Bacteroidota bacterium]